ncbi:MAG TPA: CHAP domain-containing protein [Candidatus Scybalocola faecavium]|nr:CHAP domain-containing protein [Candidatus Scybalocola faecavium]
MAFTPRLNSSGMQGSVYWYSGNPFYQSGYGLPNCTCYAWGRVYEILGYRPTYLSTGNAKDWYPHAQSATPQYCGSTPKLGAILCTYYANGGHVAVVEQINSDGSILTSNSGYSSGIYFWTETLRPPYRASWVPSGAYVQGFIYLPQDVGPPEPEPQNVSFVRWIPG